MTNDDANDAKYREWWETLKGQLGVATIEGGGIFDSLESGWAATEIILQRMLQIEQGK